MADDAVKTLEETYKPHLCKLLSFLDNVDYPVAMRFEENDERLLRITPNDVARHFNNLAYGTPTPGPGDRPTE